MREKLNVMDVSANVDQFCILEHVSFTVPENEITVILGRNGAGKTTTLRTIMGFTSVTAGRIYFRGEEITGFAPYKISRKSIGYVPEDTNVFENLTVEENLRLTLVRHGSTDTLEYLFSVFPDLKSHFKQMAGTLSGGQRQMLAIASVMAAKPEIMLIDEPSKGLSPLFVERLGNTLESLRGTTTILLVEQNFYLASRIAHNFVLMDDGTTVASGDIQTLIDSQELQQRHLGIRITGGGTNDVREFSAHS